MIKLKYTVLLILHFLIRLAVRYIMPILTVPSPGSASALQQALLPLMARTLSLQAQALLLITTSRLQTEHLLSAKLLLLLLLMIKLKYMVLLILHSLIRLAVRYIM